MSGESLSHGCVGPPSQTSDDLEIERKFRVIDGSWRRSAAGSQRIVQAYLCTGGACEVRLRLKDEVASLTVKRRVDALTREEYECNVDLRFATLLLQRSVHVGAAIEKTRYLVPVEQLLFEVDVFEGANHGLCVAEVELGTPDKAIPRPSWLGKEITHDSRYANAQLAVAPFSTWQVT